ncbi:MAG: nitrilase [Deltaproteobacteria bacterium]|nr:MAG: nitrilase [Deltaproteobacteria bacterium]
MPHASDDPTPLDRKPAVPVRMGFASLTSRIGHPEANRASHTERCIRAADAGVRLLAFPELSLTGYGLSPSALLSAEPLPGPGSDHLLNLAVKHGMVLCGGIMERSRSGKRYLTHLVCHPSGHLRWYRKLHLSPGEQTIFTPGHHIPLFHLYGMTMGIQLCYDAHFPELSTLMRQEGADVLLIPHASPRGTPEQKRDSWMRHLPARAYDNSLYVMAGNPVGSNGEHLLFPGVALGLTPDGRLASACLSADAAMLLTLDVDRDALHRLRAHPMRHFFSSRVLLSVDPSPRKIIHYHFRQSDPVSTRP